MNAQDLGLKVVHIGVNEADKEGAGATAQLFARLLGLQTMETPVSTMVGTVIEVMNSTARGTHGHIAIHADDIPAAEQYFAQHGFTIDESSRRTMPDGSTHLVYFNEEVAGFAIHLTRD